MRSRGAALMEVVLSLPLLLLLAGSISYFGYCHLLNIELNLLAWEGASALARGQSVGSWKSSLEGRQLLVDPAELIAQQKGGALSLSYPLPKPLWARDEANRIVSIAWQRPQRK